MFKQSWDKKHIQWSANESGVTSGEEPCEWVIAYYEISHTQTVDVTMSTEFNQCWGCFWPLPAHCALSVVKVKLKWHLLNFMSHAQLQVCLFKKIIFAFED